MPRQRLHAQRVSSVRFCTGSLEDWQWRPYGTHRYLLPFLASRAFFLAPFVLGTLGCAGAVAAVKPESRERPIESQGAAAAAPSGLAAEVAGWFPVPGATATCADTPLRLTFRAPVALGAGGTVRVLEVGEPSTLVAEIDIAAPTTTLEISGRTFRRPRPLTVDGSSAVIDLPPHVLQPGKKYSVVIDDGVFVDAHGGAPRGRLEEGNWTFSVGAAQPRSPQRLVVAQDGSGDFCSVQGAVDFVPPDHPGRVTIEIENGAYREIVFVSGKPELTLRGRDRRQTIILGENNEQLQNKLGSKFRALVNVEGSNGFQLENITLENTTPQGGSQAEALRVDGSEHVILRHADFKSRQDTLQLSGTVYANDCYVEGNVDYVWGKGTAYFERCEFHAVGRAGYDVQARNTDNFGYVFVDSKLTAEPELSGHVLARIEADRFPKSQVAYINCQLGPHIAPAGWLVTSGTNTKGLRFWEYQSTDPSGHPLDTSQRSPVSRQLSPAEALALRDKAKVLGGWIPNE